MSRYRYTQMTDTVKTIIQGALGAVTFGAYHQFTTNKIMELNNDKLNLEHKYSLDRMENEHKEHLKQLDIENKKYLEIMEQNHQKEMNELRNTLNKFMETQKRTSWLY